MRNETGSVERRSSAAGSARGVPRRHGRLLIAIVTAILVLIVMSSPALATSRSRGPVISSVRFLGGPRNPEVVIAGHDFGPHPTPDPRRGTSNLGQCGAIRGRTGYDFRGSLWLADRTQLWSAGSRFWVDCMGLIVRSYSDRRIVLGLGSFFAINFGRRTGYPRGVYELAPGDRVSVDVGRARLTTSVRFARPGPLRADGRYLIDPEGRVVILHGLFAVWKHSPYFPAGTDSTTDPSLPSFTDADADEVRSLGLDGVRLAWYWEGLEPAPGQYSTSYLNGIAGAEQRFASRGVYVVLDAHQDQYDQLFGNKPGFPEWSAVTDAQPVAPDPTDPGYSAWKFPLGYFHSSTDLAFGHLYANTKIDGEGIATAFGHAWQVMARRFDRDPMLAGYDVINEPFAGTTSLTSPAVGACGSSTGCPGFDRRTLEPFELSIARAIRRVDQTRTVFIEPTFYFNLGIRNHFRSPAAAAGPVGMSFHDQCPTRTAYSLTHDPQIIIEGHISCPPVSVSVFRHDRRTMAELGGPGLMTEVASTSDNDVQGLNCLLEQADQFQTGWTYGLSWSNPNDELRRLASESAVDGDAPFKESILARVFPRAVAGVPLSYGFNVRNGRFRMRYVSRPGIVAPTVISVPTQIQYPHGYVVRVTGARRISRPDASRLELLNRPGRHTVTVTVTPASGAAFTRPQFPACPAVH